VLVTLARSSVQTTSNAERERWGVLVRAAAPADLPLGEEVRHLVGVVKASR
jgi:hypothetical protein